MDVGVGRVQPQGLVVARLSLVEPPQVGQRQPQVGVPSDRLRADTHRLLQERHSSPRLTGLDKSQPKVRERLGVGGPQGDGAFEGLPRLVGPPQLLEGVCEVEPRLGVVRLQPERLP